MAECRDEENTRNYRLRSATPEEIVGVELAAGLTAYIVAARWSAGERFSYLFTWRESRHGPLSSELEDETAAQNAWNNLREHRRSARPRRPRTVAAGPIQH